MHKYSEEAKQKYGHTNAYKESIKKTSHLSKDGLREIALEGDVILNKISKYMDQEPNNKQVQDLVNEYRLFISKYYYNCTINIFRGLGNMYLEDTRFIESIDKHKEGLTEFLSRAIEYNCDNN